MLMSHLVEAYWSQILNMTLRYVMFLSMCRSLLSGAKPVTGWVIFNLNVGNYWCISQIIPLQKCLTERFFFFSISFRSLFTQISQKYLPGKCLNSLINRNRSTHFQQSSLYNHFTGLYLSFFFFCFFWPNVVG